jgi:hypothetical protein
MDILDTEAILNVCAVAAARGALISADDAPDAIAAAPTALLDKMDRPI